jgi:hypothetical protein
MKYEGTKKNSQAESGTRKDVKGEKDGRSEHMRHSHHEMGEYKEGHQHHDCAKGE